MAYVLPPLQYLSIPRHYVEPDYPDARWRRTVRPPPDQTALFDRSVVSIGGFGSGGRVIIVGGGAPPNEGQLWPRGDGSAP